MELGAAESLSPRPLVVGAQVANGHRSESRGAARPPLMSHRRELELIRLVATRDLRAFEELHHLYYPRVFRFLLSITRRRNLVEEILNDVMFTVWQKAGNFGERSRLSTWIFGIAYRKALKRLAREGRIPRQVTPEAAGLSQLAGADRAAERHEVRDLLQRALERLSPDQRAVIELTYYGGRSCREVAEIVDCPVNTVKTRMFHARKRLRELLPRLGRGPIGGRSAGEQR